MDLGRSEEEPRPRRGGSLDRAVFAPAVSLACLVILLAGTASLRIPIHRIVAPLEWLLVAAFFVGLWRWRRPRTARLLVLLGACAGLAGWLALAEFTGSWLPAPGNVLSMHPDNWSYQALSDYLDHYSRGRVDRMPTVDEYGSHLLGSRFASGTMLAFLHELPGLGDVAMAHFVFVALVLGAHFFSMLALGRALNHRAGWSMPLLAAFLSTAGGWLGHALVAANNDNLIFAALSPALLAVLCAQADGVAAGRRSAILVGALLFAGLIYNYPEGLALLGVMILPLVAVGFWPGGDPKARLNRWIVFGSIGIIGLLLAAPYLPTFVSFLQNQIAAAGMNVSTGERPGEGIFPGLVNTHRFPAVFALGEEMGGTPYHLINNLVPLWLTAFLVLGVLVLGRRHRWFPWVAVPVAGLLYWQSVGKHYDYGTFKVVICAEWWIYLAVSAGFCWALERFVRPLPWRLAATVVLLFAVGLEKYENRRYAVPLTTASQLQALQELSTLRFVTGSAPVLLALDDDMDHVWATYFLRELPLATWQQKGYLSMPHIAPYIARGNPPLPDACPFMLISGSSPEALWRNSRFSLVRRPPLFIAGAKNQPNGVDTLAGERSLWLGTKPATFLIVAPQEGNYDLVVTTFGLGPSLGGKTSAAVEVTDAQGAHTAKVTALTHRLHIALSQGANQVTLRCLETPQPGLHNGDPRELMLAVHGPMVEVRGAAPAAIIGIQNVPNGVDTVGGKQFLWLGTKPATLQIATPKDGNYDLVATMFGIGPSLAGQTSAVVEITDARGTHTATVTAETRSLPMFLAEGENAVTLRCLGTPDPGLHNHDPRELMLAVQGPWVNPAPPEP